jgi:cardiolipin synthase
MEMNVHRNSIARTPFSSADWAEQVFFRTAGAPMIPGNNVELLKDAEENYPSWIKSIEAAEKWIHFESYIIHEDDIGKEFGDLLAAKAREGLRVRVIYDWLGGLGKTSRHFWQKLRDAGVEVRCFNPLRWDSPLGWISRDHRKMIGVDGNKAFVTGLCIGNMWAVNRDKALDPWRDTGIGVTGPAVAEIEAAFAQIWAATGEPLPREEIPDEVAILKAGDTGVRVVATTPNTGGLYRLDQQIATLATQSLWLTDAYYVGTSSYIQALKAAAMDGVDVRLLVPGATDIPILRTVSRAGYKPLLESGIRVFEWNGTMIHAKTAVADSYWARVGSTNLNVASWIGNYELDVVVEDKFFAQKMEAMYLADLEHATEIVLRTRYRIRSSVGLTRPKPLSSVRSGAGSVGRVGVGAIRIGNAVGAAITNRRVLGPEELRITLTGGIALLTLGILSILVPRWITVPIAIISCWFGIALILKTWRLRWARLRELDKDGEVEGSENVS